MVADSPPYWFVPKSNRYLRPGQFRALPLADGRFAAGRVTAVPTFGDKDTRGFVAGLMEWIDTSPPDSEALAGRAVVAQGKTRVEAITNTGRESSATVRSNSTRSPPLTPTT
jgi:hypothetical protein